MNIYKMSTRKVICEDGSLLNANEDSKEDSKGDNSKDSTIDTFICEDGSLLTTDHDEFPYPEQKGWTVYGANWCGFCRRAKKMLEQKGVEMVYHDVDKMEGVDKNGVKDKLAHLSNNQRTIPIIFKDGNFVGGFTELKNLDKGLF